MKPPNIPVNSIAIDYVRLDLFQHVVAFMVRIRNGGPLEGAGHKLKGYFHAKLGLQGPSAAVLHSK